MSFSVAALLLAEALSTQSGPIGAVDTCLAAVGVGSTDDARLATDGWVERPIENIEKAPGGAPANRLFTKDGAGAAIVINIVDRDNRKVHHCHVLSQRNAKEILALEVELGRHFGGKITPLGQGSLFFEVPGRNVIVTSERKPGKDGVMIDIHTMAFELKEDSK
jgi:hypothetical protein